MFYLSSCSLEEDSVLEIPKDESIELSFEEKQKVELAKEFSLMLGDVLQDPSFRVELADLIEKVDPLGDAITLSAIMEDESRMPEKEFKTIQELRSDPRSRNKISALRSQLISFAGENLSNYKELAKDYDNHSKRTSSSNSFYSFYDEMADYFSKLGLVIHIPYEENFNWGSNNLSYTMTYDPLIRTDWNEGYLYNQSGYNQTLSYIDDPYSYLNPTFVIMYYHPDDFIAEAPIPTLPKPAANAVILGYNVNHTSISQADILLTTIPEMRVINRNWSGLFSNKVRIQIYRTSSKLNVGFDGKTPSSASGDTYTYQEYHFSKFDIFHQNWKPVNITFDPDWEMSENSQQIVVFTKHTFTGKASAKVSAKVGYDFVNKKPTAEATGSVDASVELGGAIFRQNSELSRRSVLAHIVGDTGLGTRIRNNNQYNVKGIGSLQFYYEHYFTDIPE